MSCDLKNKEGVFLGVEGVDPKSKIILEKFNPNPNENRFVFGYPGRGRAFYTIPLEGEEYPKLHHHSLAVIRNTFEETPDKYLLHFDERWQCRLFLNWKSKENQEEDLENIKKQLSTELQIDAETIQGQLWFEQVHEKYSVSADKNKWYHHSFYDMQISEFPDWAKQPDFEVNGKHFCWMTIEEMEANPRIMEVNADIVGMIKEAERR